MPETDDQPAGVAVYLEHRDPALSIELYSAENSDDVVAEWQLWSRVLGVPALVAGSDGEFSEPFPRLGAVLCKAPAQRRRRRSPLAKRRPRFLTRRRAGVSRVVAARASASARSSRGARAFSGKVEAGFPSEIIFRTALIQRETA